MKLNSKFVVVKSLMILFCGALFSFSSSKGGDSFEIRLNGKRVIQQFVHVTKGVQTLHLAQTSDKDKLDIYYSHCGQIGTSRYITIKDEKNRPLKVWKFSDVGASTPVMSFNLKDIVSLKKNNGDKLGIYYSSHELPHGRLLAILDSGNQGVIAMK